MPAKKNTKKKKDPPQKAGGSIMVFSLVDIISGDTQCEKCHKPITHIYIIEDERKNRHGVGSECFRQLVGGKAPRARQYIDLKERVRRNVEQAHNLSSIQYQRDTTSRSWSIGLPSLPNNLFLQGKSESPRFDVEEETINELKRRGWREYEEPTRWASRPSRYILINPYTKRASEIETSVLKSGWKLFDNPQKRLKLAYYNRGN